MDENTILTELKFSIILPVYNREKIVPFTIQSVIAQDYPNWELIIVDDKSTDDSRSICESFSDNDHRIKVYAHNENKGASAAKNTALKFADGDYILFLDSDDQIHESAISKLASICKGINPDIIVFGIRGLWTPSEKICNRILDKESIYNNILPQHINICEHTGFFLQPYIWNKCYRKSMISENGIEFEERRRVWEDNTFLVQCINKCDSIYIIKDELHIPGYFPEADHLSFHVDETVILQYIDGYKDNVRQFGDRYDFNNDYTPRRYFDVINDQLRQLCPKISAEQLKKLLSTIINEQVVQDWISRINPKDKTEEAIKSAYLSKDVDGLYHIYYNASMEIKETKARHIKGLFKRIKAKLN